MTSYTRLRFGDVWWRVRSDAARLLFDAAGLRLASWLESGQASIVKQGPHRTVYRVQLDGRSVYIKHIRVPDTRAMLSQWIQSSKSRREWDRIEQAAGWAIPTIVPLALGEQRKAGLVFENFLITEGIDEVESLDIFVQNTLPKLPTQRQGQLRRRLADGLAELTARLHEAGVVHPDLHAGNVLVKLDDTGGVQLHLVDLEEAVPRDRASWRRSRKNLLDLGLFFLLTARGVDRARFLRRYLKVRDHLGLDWKSEAAGLDRDLARKARSFWRRLDARCTSNNRRFFYRNIGTAHGFAATELGESTLMALLRDPDAPIQSAGAEVLKKSPSSAVVRLLMSLGGKAASVVYKRCNCPKWLDPLRATLSHSPALRAWRAGHGLLIRRIPTPRPLAVIERTRGPLVHENYLITQAIPGAISLRVYLKDVVTKLPAGERQQRVRWIVRQMGRLVRRMHDWNISHRDMKASNFLVALNDRATGSPELYLIDLAGVQMWRTLPAARRLQNLARILVSLESYAAVARTDTVRFLRAYQSGRHRNPLAWKSLWKDLQSRMGRKIARNQRRNRPVT